MHLSRLIVSVIFIFFYSNIAQAAEMRANVCDNTYALCSAASCQPIPGEAKKVLCSCSVWKGKNIGFTSCGSRAPKKTADGQTTLLSTFSFGGGYYQYMNCPAISAWASCLDKPCFIDKKSPDGRKAVCTCELEQGKPFVTFAGECNTANCNKAIWSGATLEGNQLLMKILSKAENGNDLGKAACQSKTN